MSEKLLAAFQEYGALQADDGLSERIVDAIPPSFGSERLWRRFHPSLTDALHKRGLTRLYEHQAEAIEAALDGNNVVLQAPPASGKSLAFQIPIIDSLLRNPDEHALLIYPMRALSLDQEAQFNDLLDELPGRPLSIDSYDGDKAPHLRKPLRADPPDILRTTPDMTHLAFLGWNRQWRGFLRNLRWIVVDEIHEYRGHFGSHVSLILRRLSHHLKESYGVEPQIIMSSATCANAQEHAQNLTGRKFVEVDASSALQPERRYWFVQPDIGDENYWDELIDRTVSAGLACLREDQAVIAFCPTTKFTEDCRRRAVEQIESDNLGSAHKLDPNAIRVFRGALSAEMRREIQRDLQNGTVKLVFATNALEVGINVGGLDGVILAGFPDNMMSARQQIGRAGRSWEAEAFVLYLPRNNPLDQYYAKNLDEFVEKALEPLVVNPSNTELTIQHAECLLYETKDFRGGIEILGPGLDGAVWTRKPVFRFKPGRAPHRNLDIRGGAGGTFKLFHDGDEIGVMGARTRFREAYEDAVYLHGGETYRVDSVTTKRGGDGEIQLEREESYLRTNPKISAGLSGEDVYECRRWDTDQGPIEALYGQVTVTERLHLVEEVDERTGARLRTWEPRDNTAHYWDSEACWIEYPREVGSDPLGVEAIEQILRVGVLLSILVDPHDIVGQSGGNEIRASVAESYSGGIGIASQVLEGWRAMLEVGISVAEGCACVTGCPNCIVPPRSRAELDKRLGIEIARWILEETDSDFRVTTRGGKPVI